MKSIIYEVSLLQVDGLGINKLLSDESLIQDASQISRQALQSSLEPGTNYPEQLSPSLGPVPGKAPNLSEVVTLGVNSSSTTQPPQVER